MTDVCSQRFSADLFIVFFAKPFTDIIFYVTNSW